MTAVVLAAGAAFALWMLARRCAYRRGIELGGTPYVPLALLCAVTVLAGHGNSIAARAALLPIGAAALVDARCGYVFDPLVVAGLGVVCAVAALDGRAVEAALGAVTVAPVLLLLRLVSPRGFGLGDVKLAAVVGSGFGPSDGLMAMGTAFIVGGASAVVLLALGRVKLGERIPFVPYVLAGSLFVLAYHRLRAGVFS